MFKILFNCLDPKTEISYNSNLVIFHINLLPITLWIHCSLFHFNISIFASEKHICRYLQIKLATLPADRAV